MAQKNKTSLLVMLLILQAIVFLGITVGERKSEAQGRCVSFRLRSGSGVISGYTAFSAYGLRGPIRVRLIQE